MAHSDLTHCNVVLQCSESAQKAKTDPQETFAVCATASLTKLIADIARDIDEAAG